MCLALPSRARVRVYYNKVKTHKTCHAPEPPTGDSPSAAQQTQRAGRCRDGICMGFHAARSARGRGDGAGCGRAQSDNEGRKGSGVAQKSCAKMRAVNNN